MQYINQNFDANLASARFDVMTDSGKRGGFDVACMRFVEFLRHLALMLRHHSAIRHISGSAQKTLVFGSIPESGSPSESQLRNQMGYQTGQVADNWQGTAYATPATCLIQTNKCLKPARIVPSLVTT